MKRILAATVGNFYRPLLITAIFTGLRASELRGLPWRNVALRGELHVRQRADRYNKIGPPKSKAGRRTIPLGPMVVNTLQAWKLACPPNEHDLVFPSPRDLTILRLDSIVTSGLIPVMIAAGVVTSTGEAKYTGLHALRHFYASWCINRRAEGGLELSPKLVQARLGHATLTMTMDTYGHLFPRTDDGAELIAAEKLLLA